MGEFNRKKVLVMRTSLPALVVAFLCAMCTRSDSEVLTKERYLDGCKGAWAGQMIGVCFAAPYEFRSNGQVLSGDLQPWTSKRVEKSLGQDDCYVEMTFLKALERYGLDVTFEQAGTEFGATQFNLWHANLHGRENIRHGVVPPKSGTPEYNQHADDIDFQIEADILGILTPGLPRESNRLCNVFGRIMNYGDGLYGGMFIAGMYSAAYFEDRQVKEVIAAGLRCIPRESLYHQCISDVVQWHGEQPDDWMATWKRIEDKWQDDVDCLPNNPYNIDAKLNGAYVALVLLYGAGDWAKTLELATRCGQDCDCNASNAAGVLGCMQGYNAIPPEYTQGIRAMADAKFSFTVYSFNSLVPACRGITESIIKRAGGTIENDRYVIPLQEPEAPPLEQWTDQSKLLKEPVSDHEVKWWNPAWSLESCGPIESPGLRNNWNGKQNVLVIHPASQDKPAALMTEMDVPKKNPCLKIEVSSARQGDFLLRVLAEDRVLLEKVIDTEGDWKTLKVKMKPFAGRKVKVRIEDCANGWSHETAVFGKITLE